MADRRDALKIIGAIGTTCAFPFSADELYGQHSHGTEAPLPKPSFFTAAELAAISTIADLIIPRTNTPGAVDANVPAYIDYVCSRNAAVAGVIREGLTRLPARIDAALLQKLYAERSPFFTTMKNLTADGYYTSRVGLIEELGYQGNTVLAQFPSCEIPEH